MGDSLERLYLAVLAAKDLDPATSRTARLFQRGQAKMAKKLAEEAIEVVIDAVNGNSEAVVRESADLLYNLTVIWASAGVRPEDVWAEMERREQMLGIAEKLPKSPPKMPETTVAAPAAAVAVRRRIVALDGRRAPKRPRHPQFLPYPDRANSLHGGSPAAMLRRMYDWCIGAADKPYAVWMLGVVSFAESSFFPVPPDVMLIPMSLAQPERAWLFALVCTITSVAGGVLGYAIGALLYDSIGGVDHPASTATATRSRRSARPMPNRARGSSSSRA